MTKKVDLYEELHQIDGNRGWAIQGEGDHPTTSTIGGDGNVAIKLAINILQRHSPRDTAWLVMQAGGQQVDTFIKSEHNSRAYLKRLLESTFKLCDKDDIAWEDGLVALYEELALDPTSMHQETNFTYKTYVYSNPGDLENGLTGHVTLRGTSNMLEGNTGCHAWEASFSLFEFIVNFTDIFRGKTILELGSGCGLAGIALQRIGARRILLTDGNDLALDNLEQNLKINQLDQDEEGSLSEQETSVFRLDWMHALEDKAHEHLWADIDLVIGSDITYDAEIMPSLMALIEHILSKGKGDKRGYLTTIKVDRGLKCVDEQKQVHFYSISS